MMPTRSHVRSTSSSSCDDEEDRAAALALLGDERDGLLLHQRVQAARRLVEDQQLGLVEGGLHEADLLAVATRQLAQRAVEVRLEALGQRVRAADAAQAAQAAEIAIPRASP